MKLPADLAMALVIVAVVGVDYLLRLLVAFFADVVDSVGSR